MRVGSHVTGWMVAWTQSDIDLLKSAIADARGARVLQFSDQKTEFHNIPEQMELLARMEREVNSSTHRSHRYAVTSKGT